MSTNWSLGAIGAGW